MSADKQNRRLFVESAEAAAAEVMSDLRETTTKRVDLTADLLSGVDDIGPDSCRRLATAAAADGRIVRHAADRLEFGLYAAEAAKVSDLVSADRRKETVNQLYRRRAADYGAKTEAQAVQQAKRAASRAVLIETFNEGADGSYLNPIISVGILSKVLGACVEEVKGRPGVWQAVRPTYDSEGRKVAKQSRPITAEDIAIVRSAARKAYGARGGVSEAAFRDALRDAGFLPPAKVQQAAEELTEADLDNLFKADHTEAVDLVSVFAQRCADGLLSASEALDIVRQVAVTFGRTFAPTVDNSESAAAEAVRSIIGHEVGPEAAEAEETEAAAASASGRVDDSEV